MGSVRCPSLGQVCSTKKPCGAFVRRRVFFMNGCAYLATERELPMIVKSPLVVYKRVIR